MGKEILLKEYIREFDNHLYQTKKEEVIYRIISIKNIFFFAEEISTGSIFPIYYFSSTENLKDKLGNHFNSHSYEKFGKYYLYCPLEKINEIFRFKIDSNDENLKLPNIEEVNKYLKEKENDLSWSNLIKKYERKNVYNCDIEVLKSIITKAKEDMGIEELNFNSELPSNKIYSPCIDIEEIKEFGYDLSTKEVLTDIIERESETKRVIKNACIKGKSTLIVGPSGSGKTTIIQNLAQKIKNNEEKWLQDKIIFNVNIGSLTAGTKYRGEFENKLKKLINFCLKNKNKIILFIDEIHTLYGLGRTEGNSLDAMNILKPYISDGEITVIGATTNYEYQKYMANDPAFIERFEIEHLQSIDIETNIKIIISYIKELEKKYNIKLNMNDTQIYDITKYLINITDKKHQIIVGDSIKVSNPRISKSIIEEAFVEAVYNENKEVTVEDICFAIISCDKLSPTFRKERAEELKTKLNIAKNKPKILELAKTNI